MARSGVIDFPSAHSMDTEWYAVDDQGRIARFDSGEDGAVPNNAAWGMSPGDPSFDTTLLDCARLGRMLGSGVDPTSTFNEMPEPKAGRTLLVVDAQEAFDELVASDELVAIRTTLPMVLLSHGSCSEERIREISQVDGVRWVLDVDWLYELLEAEAADGLFHFHRDHGDDPGRYQRSAVPSSPLSLKDLAPEAQAVGELRLPVDFSTDEVVHLADHITDDQASMWGDWTLRSFDTPHPRASATATGLAKHWLTLIVVVIILVVLWWLR